MPDILLSKYDKIAKFDSTLVENMEILSGMSQYYKWVSEIIRKHAGKRVLEIGCANGNLTRFFLDKEKIIGADYSKEYIDHIKKRFKDKRNFSAKLLDITKSRKASALKRYKFDTIITMNTYEHIKNDLLAFKNAYNILEKNGKMIVFVPAGMWLYSILDYEGGHYRRYLKHELAEKMKKTGFIIEDIFYFNAAGAFGWYLFHVLMKKRIYSSSSFLLYNYFVPIFKLCENIMTPPFGLSLVCVGRKK